MNLILYVLLIISFGCSYSQNEKSKPKDIFETIFLIKKNPSLKRVQEEFGKPASIEVTRSDKNIDEHKYNKNNSYPTLSVFIERSSNKAIGFGITLSLETDTYEFLKERFKGYKWIEKPIPSKAVDYAEELYLVEIPELGIGFQYDNQDPLRRPLWIYIK